MADVENSRNLISRQLQKQFVPLRLYNDAYADSFHQTTAPITHSRIRISGTPI